MGSRLKRVGAVVRMARDGISYRRAPVETGSRWWRRPSFQPPAGGQAEPLAEIDSGDAAKMVDSSSAELLEEINLKLKMSRRWPWAALSLPAAAWLASAMGPGFWLFGLAAAGFTFWVHRLDRLRRTLFLQYDFGPRIKEAYRALHEKAAEMSACAGLWHVEAEGGVSEPKYQAGAKALIRRRRTSLGRFQPRHVKTNVDTIRLKVGRQTLYFLPDRLLVFDRRGVGAVAYRDLTVETAASEFVETGRVPDDARVVGKTWRYVNRKGGPDRRFRDNKELPVCLYEKVHFKSPSGLNEQIQLSRAGVGAGFAEALSRLAQRISLAERAGENRRPG